MQRKWGIKNQKSSSSSSPLSPISSDLSLRPSSPRFAIPHLPCQPSRPSAAALPLPHPVAPPLPAALPMQRAGSRRCCTEPQQACAARGREDSCRCAARGGRGVLAALPLTLSSLPSQPPFPCACGATMSKCLQWRRERNPRERGWGDEMKEAEEP